MFLNKIKEFLHLEVAGGIILILATLLAMVARNSPAAPWYDALLGTQVAVAFGDFTIAKPLLLWINDGLMAIFFFLIGLEVKREVLAGELAEPAKVILPIIAAIGGMAIPAVIYSLINRGDAVALAGWAIPSATDIAFALGVLALAGSRVPGPLKLFLMTLAIVDDLGAIVIIALFYTGELSTGSLAVAGGAMVVLFLLNRRGVLRLAPYLLVGVVLWTAVLKSGVHATLAGVVTAFFIPYKKQDGARVTQLERLEHDLHPSVVYAILPLFAFANAGIPFGAESLSSLLHPIPLGIAAGLFFGNQIGVFGFSVAAIKTGLCRLPEGVSYLQLYAVSLLCGIGFTMSLFVSSLAFEGTPTLLIDERPGILLGSLLSAVAGFVVLQFSLRRSS